MKIDCASFGFVIRIVMALCVGLPFLWVACQALRRMLSRHLSTHVSVLVSNIALYMGCIFLGISILHELGFNVSALLGAAGIIGIAVGFAAQTSVANIISGLFLVLEGSCTIGDQIEHGSLSGTIESIDLLAVKVRTVENTFVRIPNEFFIKKVMVNRTYYPVRIVAFKVCVPFEYEVSKVVSMIDEVLVADAFFLSQPAPKISLYEVTAAYVTGSDQSSYITNDIKVELWVKKETARQVRDAFVMAVQKRLHRENIRAALVRL